MAFQYNNELPRKARCRQCDACKRGAKKEKTADVESADISDIKTGSAFKNGHLQHKISVTIGDTKDSAAVQELIDKKLFADYDQFLEGLKTTGGSMDQVQPGTINFNKGASAEDVLKALVTTA